MPLLDALTSVIDPILDRPAVAAGLITEDSGGLTYRLLSPFPSVQKTIRERIEAALKPSTSMPSLRWELTIPSRGPTSEDPAPGVKNVILVMSGKGGVGKSTTAVNLAVALAQAGAKVGLLDANLYGPSIPTMLGISAPPTSADGVAIDPLVRFDVKLMSIGFMMEDDKTAVVWRGPMLHRALLQFLKDVKWGELDYLLLDLPPGTGDVALTLAQGIRTTGAVIVTTPQEVALQDVYKSVSMCKRLEIPVLGVVENMSHFIDSAGVRHELFGRGGGEKVATFAGSRVLGHVPIDPAARVGGDEGTPVVKAAPQSASAIAFTEIATELSRVVAQHLVEKTGPALPDVESPKRLKIVR